jgi:hypothetical protein
MLWECIKVMVLFIHVQGTLSERITVMVAAPYAQQLLFKKLPRPPQIRHVNQQVCLCQFAEILISEYFQVITRGGATGLKHLLASYLNCSIKRKMLGNVEALLASAEECYV